MAFFLKDIRGREGKAAFPFIFFHLATLLLNSIMIDESSSLQQELLAPCIATWDIHHIIVFSCGGYKNWFTQTVNVKNGGPFFPGRNMLGIYVT